MRSGLNPAPLIQLLQPCYACRMAVRIEVRIEVRIALAGRRVVLRAVAVLRALPARKVVFRAVAVCRAGLARIFRLAVASLAAATGLEDFGLVFEVDLEAVELLIKDFFVTAIGFPPWIWLGI